MRCANKPESGTQTQGKSQLIETDTDVGPDVRFIDYFKEAIMKTFPELNYNNEK